MKRINLFFFIFLLLSPNVIYLNIHTTETTAHQQNSTDTKAMVGKQDDLTAAVSTKKDNQDEEEKEKPSDTQVILGHFASVVGNMFNIMQDPENPQNVGNNITGIFSNIVGLAVHAIQDKLGPESTEEEIQEFIEKNLDPELKEALRNIIVNRARQIRKKPA